MEGKTALNSKTIRYQVISTIVVGVIASSQVASPFMSAEVLAAVVAGLKVVDMAVNVYLRYVTNQPIK